MIDLFALVFDQQRGIVVPAGCTGGPVAPEGCPVYIVEKIVHPNIERECPRFQPQKRVGGIQSLGLKGICVIIDYIVLGGLVSSIGTHSQAVSLPAVLPGGRQGSRML